MLMLVNVGTKGSEVEMVWDPSPGRDFFKESGLAYPWDPYLQVRETKEVSA